MSFFDSIQSTFSRGKDKVLAEVSKYRHASFMEGVVSSAIFIAIADGKISSEEKQKLFGYVKMADELKAFSTEDVIEVFKKVTDAYEFDPIIGKGEALKRIHKLKSVTEQARLAVQVSIAIANSDGVFDENEKKAVQELCKELGLSDSDFTS